MFTLAFIQTLDYEHKKVGVFYHLNLFISPVNQHVKDKSEIPFEA